VRLVVRVFGVHAARRERQRAGSPCSDGTRRLSFDVMNASDVVQVMKRGVAGQEVQPRRIILDHLVQPRQPGSHEAIPVWSNLDGRFGRAAVREGLWLFAVTKGEPHGDSRASSRREQSRARVRRRY
jgi:hypothetical protein